jgi:hypothetical protein
LQGCKEHRNNRNASEVDVSDQVRLQEASGIEDSRSSQAHCANAEGYQRVLVQLFGKARISNNNGVHYFIPEFLLHNEGVKGKN